MAGFLTVFFDESATSLRQLYGV